MAAGRVGASGFATAGGTSRTGMRSRIIQSPPPQAGPGWMGAPGARTSPKMPGSDIAAVGLALSSFTDSFDDNFTDPALWPNSFGTYSETGGRARVSCDAGFNAYSSALTYRLAESSMFLRVFPPAAGGATTEAWTQILIKQQTNGTDIGFEVSPLSGNLTMFSRTGFFDPGAVAIPYDPTGHAWLRIRETSGTVYWDTSPDTLTWTNQRTLASPTWVNDPNLEYQLIAHRSDGTNDYAEYDNLNTGPVIATGDAATTVTVTATAAGSIATTGSGSLAAAATVSAAGTTAAVGTATTLATASITAAGTHAANAQADRTSTASLSAAGTVGTTGAATTAITTSATAAGRTDTSGAAAATGTATLTGAGLRATSTTASTALTGSLAAAGTVAAQATADTAAVIALSADGTVVFVHDDIDVTVGKPYSPWTVGDPQGASWPVGQPH
ncbi:hypothetical protein OG762_36980 [Streptomyces sp. NBC_01136]|uniref:hypothetical protein n=1 Tax=Streptomyces sp. NBC_01136 TaxID=2903754 RepID=UPI00386ED202|nr:hypothetical protein OG762_36980 [Streptomyces sp. NBC_01136]